MNALERIQQLGYRLEDLPLETVTTCNLCGATENFAILTDQDRYGFAVKNYFCRRCGFTFVSPRPTPQGYAQFYEKFYRGLTTAMSGQTLTTPELIKGMVDKQQAYAERIDRVLLGDKLAVGKHKTLLDVGGSTGALSRHFVQKYGMTATVIDPAPDELAVAKQAGYNTFLGVFEDFPAEAQFDLILLSRTVHHLQDLNVAFAKLRHLMHPQSLLYIDMLDFLAICRLRNYSIRDATQVDHCNSLVAPVLEAFFSKHGFKPVLTDFSQPKYVNYVVRLAEAPHPLTEYPYAEGYLKDLLTITNSANLEAYLKGISRFVKPSAPLTPRARLGQVWRRLRR